MKWFLYVYEIRYTFWFSRFICLSNCCFLNICICGNWITDVCGASIALWTCRVWPDGNYTRVITRDLLLVPNLPTETWAKAGFVPSCRDSIISMVVSLTIFFPATFSIKTFVINTLLLLVFLLHITPYDVISVVDHPTDYRWEGVEMKSPPPFGSLATTQHSIAVSSMAPCGPQAPLLCSWLLCPARTCSSHFLCCCHTLDTNIIWVFFLMFPVSC